MPSQSVSRPQPPASPPPPVSRGFPRGRVSTHPEAERRSKKAKMEKALRMSPRVYLDSRSIFLRPGLCCAAACAPWRSPSRSP